MYFHNTINEKIYIKCDDLKSYNSNNISTNIKKLISNKFGNKCQKYGLLIKDSIKIIERSIGEFNDGHFNSSISYNVTFEAKICNPPEGIIIQCTAVSSNKMGVLACVGENLNDSPLVILLARQHHIDNKLFKAIKEGKQIYALVIGKKFDLNDKQISIVGKLSNLSEYKKQHNLQNDFLESDDEEEIETEESDNESDSDIREYKLPDEDNLENKDEDDEEDEEYEEDEDDEEEYLKLDDEDEDVTDNLVVNSEEEEEEEEDI